MYKDFDNWNKIKKEVDEGGLSKLYHARRLVEKIGFLDKTKFSEIRKAVKDLF